MPAAAFATLRPTNTLGRLAFSDLYETFTIKRQNTQEDASPAFQRMAVEGLQTFDGDVLRLRLETERRASQNAYSSDAETSDGLQEPESDMEEQHQELGKIWIGHYVLGLNSAPFIPERGYTVGKGPLENINFDLLLCTKSFAKWHGINLRNPHGRFNFSPGNRGLYVVSCSRSQSTQLTVNGESAQWPYALNQHSMNIRFDKLEYTFQWTDYAATEDFMKKRSKYVTSTLGGPLEVDVDLPTPLPNRRMIGRWTLGEALGAGGHGRVFFATNPLGEIAAVKMIERTSKNYGIVDAEVQVCDEVTTFAGKYDDGGRILRVVEVLYSKDKKFSFKVAFDNIAVVLQPMTPRTLADSCGVKSKGGSKGMTIETAITFRDALAGLQVMHNGGWTHRDLKPTNIGVVGTPARAVLLDVGTSAYLRHGTTIKPNPGAVGTIGYLAPELELEDYNHSIDIWAMGVTLYYLTYKHHPWHLALNPWRDGKENEELRPHFRKMYQEAIDKMTIDYNIARQSPTAGYIHRECFVHV
ncbi:kinase-like domain-containing protein [Xylaria acuta]|nr:kinase-like domain-containing protein [Xylaria acuta]